MKGILYSPPGCLLAQRIGAFVEAMLAGNDDCVDDVDDDPGEDLPFFDDEAA